jgi:hypothetical protein
MIAMSTKRRRYSDRPVKFEDVINVASVLSDIGKQKEMLDMVPDIVPPSSGVQPPPEKRQSTVRPTARVQREINLASANIFVNDKYYGSDAVARMVYLDRADAEKTFKRDQPMVDSSFIAMGIRNFVLMNSSNDTLATWNDALTVEQRYIQVALWVLFNADERDIDSKKKAARFLLDHGVPDPNVQPDPTLRSVISNDVARLSIPDIVGVLTSYPDASAVLRIFNDKRRDPADRKNQFYDMSVEAQVLAMIGWLSDNASSDIRLAALLKRGAWTARKVESERSVHDLRHKKGSHGTTSEIALFNDVYDGIVRMGGIFTAEQKGLMSRTVDDIRRSLDMLVARNDQLKLHNPSPHLPVEDLERQISEHRGVLDRWMEMSNTSSSIAMRDQIKKYNAEVIELERKGDWLTPSGKRAYENLTLNLIPSLNTRYRMFHAFNGSKSLHIGMSRINLADALRQYQVRLPHFNRFVDLHTSSVIWKPQVAVGMGCPINNHVRELTDMMLFLESKLERFKGIMGDIGRSLTKLEKGNDPAWTKALVDASPFRTNELLNMLVGENDMVRHVADVRRCAISFEDVSGALAYALKHVDAMTYTNGEGKPTATPIYIYIKKYLVPFSQSYASSLNLVGEDDAAAFPWRGFTQDAHLSLIKPEMSQSFPSHPYEVNVDGDGGEKEKKKKEEDKEEDDEDEGEEDDDDDDDISDVLTSREIEDVYGKSEYEAFMDTHERDRLTDDPPHVITHWTLDGPGMVGDCSKAQISDNLGGTFRGMMNFQRYAMMHVLEPQPVVDTWVRLGRTLAIRKKSGMDLRFSNALSNAYIATCIPLSRILHEYRRSSCGYDREPHSVPGITALCIYTKEQLQKGHNVLFPTFPYGEIVDFTRRIDNLMGQFPLRYMMLRDVSPIRCVEDCVSTLTMLRPGSMLPFGNDQKSYRPIWFNSDPGDATLPMHPMPSPDGMVVPLWSPMPDAMNARESQYSVPSEFILPGAIFGVVRKTRPVQSSISQTVTTGKSFRSRWLQHAYDNRVFLTPGGKVSKDACAYRMGRFIAGCPFANDNYYAWQAESGTFVQGVGGLVFVPRQHVAMVFAHCANEQSRYQFNNRCSSVGGRPSPLISSMLQGFCGVLSATFCMPPSCKTNLIENGPWHCGVFNSFDGTLGTFLEGPDVEMCDSTDDDISGENGRDRFLTFACHNVAPDFSRFRMMSSMPAVEYWSRLVTFVHVMDGVFGCISNVLRDSVGSMPAICPENFVYDVNGVSLANIANSLYLKVRTKDQKRSLSDPKSPVVYCRTSKYDVHLARRFNRRTMYNFRMLGIGSSCGKGYIDDETMRNDSANRCMSFDMSRIVDEFPLRHASDRFLPTLLAGAIGALVKNAVSDLQRVSVARVSNQFGRTISYSQSIILARYVFFKMGLCRPEMYAKAASLQADHKNVVVSFVRQQCEKNRVDPAVDCGLTSYAHDSHDMGLLFSHRLDSINPGMDAFRMQEYLARSGLPNDILAPLGTIANAMSGRSPSESSREAVSNALGMKDGGTMIANTEKVFHAMRDAFSGLVERVNARLPSDPKGRDFYVISPQDESTNQLDITPLK